MKRILSMIVLLACCILQGCVKDQIMTRTTVYRPEYKTKEEVRANIKSSNPIELTAPGKLFYKDGYVFLNELNKGVHIIDARNPASPANIAFVHVPGAVDLAVRGNILYADMYTDLVAIDISDPRKVQLKTVLPGVFPDRYYSSFIPDKDMVITEWIAVDTVLKHNEAINWGLKSADMVRTMSASSSSAAGAHLTKTSPRRLIYFKGQPKSPQSAMVTRVCKVILLPTMRCKRRIGIIVVPMI